MAFAAHEIPLAGDAKRSLFRPNRDGWFSKDKRPYKTSASAILSRDGSKGARGVLYFHLGGHEREAFVAAGFYGPEPDDLARLRAALAKTPQRTAALEAQLAQAGLRLSRDGALVRPPKGYEDAGDAIAEMLKLKSLIVRSLPLERLYGAGLIDDVVTFAQNALPLLESGWAGLRWCGERALKGAPARGDRRFGRRPVLGGGAGPMWSRRSNRRSTRLCNRDF